MIKSNIGINELDFLTVYSGDIKEDIEYILGKFLFEFANKTTEMFLYTELTNYLMGYHKLTEKEFKYKLSIDGKKGIIKGKLETGGTHYKFNVGKSVLND